MRRFQTRSFIRVTATLALLHAAGCHEDITVGTSASATDESAVPSPADTEPTGGGIDPKDYCRLNPTDDFEGHNYACSGAILAGFAFDYYGDPDIDIAKYLPCKVSPDPQPEGYVTTCGIELINGPFSPDTALPNVGRFDACCLPDSPQEAVDTLCRFDVAEELCLAGAEQLNAFRKQVPVIPKLEQINLQLVNLNKFFAESGTQTACSTKYRDDLLKAGNFEDVTAANWSPDAPHALDPELGWPWFRNFITGVNLFKIDGSEDSGVACSDVTDDALTGDALTGGALAGGELRLTSYLGSAAVAVTGGSFSFAQTDCALDSCPFRLATLEVDLVDFAVGPLTFSDVSAALVSPADGLLRGQEIDLPAGRMNIVARFRLAIGGRPAFDGALLSAGFSNDGAVRARLTPRRLFALEKLDATSWPFDATLVTKPSPCQ